MTRSSTEEEKEKVEERKGAQALSDGVRDGAHALANGLTNFASPGLKSVGDGLGTAGRCIGVGLGLSRAAAAGVEALTRGKRD